MTERFGDLRLKPRRRLRSEQLRLPGMEPDLPDPSDVIGQKPESLKPPNFPGEPLIFKPEGGDLSPWQRARLDREYVQIAQIVADTEIKQELARAGIRERDEKREGKQRHRDELRKSKLETKRCERQDRRIERYVMLALFSLATLVAALRTPIALPAIAVVAGLQLRVLLGNDRTSVWEWLIRRGEQK